MRAARFLGLVLLLAGCGASSDPSPVAATPAADAASIDSGASEDAAPSSDGASPDAAGDAAAPAACADPPVGTVVGVTVAQLAALRAEAAVRPLAIVDVREPSETADGIIEGALLYPWTSGVLAARHAELPKDRPLYVICRSGNRSAAATAFLAKNGHACVHDTQGGMLAWVAAAYPTVKP